MSSRLAAIAVLLCLTPPLAAFACPGDCAGDGDVTVAELLTGVNIALGSAALEGCPAFDTGADGRVDVAELLAAVNAALRGCPSPIATPTITPTATPANRPPTTATPFVYRGFAGQAIALPLGAVDPEGEPLQCGAADLPEGMTLDPDQVLRWTPADDQLGPRDVPFTCSDAGEPPAAVSGALTLHVAADDACAMPVCDPATGCSATLPPSTETCCAGARVTRVAEVTPECPHGRVLEIGRNLDGFGPLRNCDRLRLLTSAQSSAQLVFHIRVSCLNPLNRVTVTARLDTASRGLAVNIQSSVFLPAQPTDGFYERRNVRFPVLSDGPYFDLDDAEANLTVTVRDADGASVSRSLRLLLHTRATPADIPD